jgi:Flp pilus assembly protein TadD
VRNFVSRTGLLTAVVALSVLLACEGSQQARNPGALPTGVKDIAPRLNASTYVAHGDLLERQGNFEQAILQYRQALELTPDLSAARTRLGITLNKLGRNTEASAEFREAVARTPNAAYLHNNLGFSLYLEGKYAEAETALAQAVKLQPTFRRAHLNRGVVLAKLGRYDDALAAFCLGGAEADAHYNLAVMQADAGRFAAAARSLEQALKLNPELAAARQELKDIARLAAAQEETERAAVAQAAAAEQEMAAAPTASATEDVQMAAAVELAAEPAAPALPAPPADGVNPGAVVLQEIDALLALTSVRTLDEAEYARAHILVALFDEIAAQLPSNPPLNESSVCHLKDVLDRLNTPN